MAFQVVDGDQRQSRGECQGFAVGDTDQQSAGKSGAGGDGDRVQIGKRHASLGQRRPDHGNDGAQVLAAGQFGDDATVARVGCDLRGHHGAERATAALDDGCCGLVTGGFDGEDEAGAHVSSLKASAKAD